MVQPRPRAAVVVAHPDDEAMWGVSYPLRQSGFAWTVIICSTPEHDPQRILSARRSCEILKCNLIVLEEQTRGALTFPDLDLTPYTFIVTHNSKGEYGHKQHIQVHERVRRAGKPYVCFGYGYQNPHTRIMLTPEETATRIQALKCYDYTAKWDGGHVKADALIETYHGNDWKSLSRESYVLSG